jgi:glycosyltransferase involved in cell wall biosynthesis
MLNGRSVAVVVPAYNEEKQIRVVLETMPLFVDRIIVVNDCSKDKTAEIVLECIKNDKSVKKDFPTLQGKLTRGRYNEADIILQSNLEKEIEYYASSEIINKAPEKDRIILINNKVNNGVGACVARGYKWCLDHKIYCTAVMAGDGQMDPGELESLCNPIVNDEVDYVKGNRLIHRSALFVIPKIRYFGNSVLSALTKVTSGYWHISDTQTGYTAISLKALKSICIYNIYKRYGYPNDLLVKLNIAFCTIREVEIKPIYRIGEKSKMNLLKTIPRISFLLGRLFFKRLWVKYCFRDFHPLFLFYNFSFLLILILIPYVIKVGMLFVSGQRASFETLMAFMFLATSSFQSLFFAMWMDIQDNERLHK